ncbi:antibiotic biosynthesis monooxygenase family protein [Desulfobacter postgatei]|uniref:putative quinol monooxygenase n=1 Tax=Desulfobacter postgatei TaxID=2293 RepID=UPI00259BE114|nr:antibiotic biosynthesis monooxygenase family protein [uncultured Desulfobacter sp.]
MKKEKRQGLIRASIRIHLSLKKQREALEILKSVREQTKVEPDCIYTRLYRGSDDENILMLEELWRGEQALLNHLKTDIYRRVLLVIEMSDIQPEISFDRILASDGIETIKKAREKY